MVAVGTRISPRPPHRSRRALLTHRAPPSGQTSCDERFSHVRRPTRSHYSDRRGVSAQCPNRGRITTLFPWVRPFPPRLPPGVASPCSVASQVLWPHPTSHPRTCSVCGLSPSRGGPAHESAHG